MHKGNARFEYTYDPFHRRLSKTTYTNGKLSDILYFLWDGKNEIGSITKEGKIKELRVLGDGRGAEIGAAILYELNGNSYFPIHDHRGSLVTLIDITASKPKATYRYTPFGETIQSENLSPWRYCSKRFDPETGFYYFGRRYYSPELGRWISPDPQGFSDGPNLYAYLHNNPLMGIDLYGLWNKQDSFGRNSRRAFISGFSSAVEFGFPITSEFNRQRGNCSNWNYALLAGGAAFEIITTFLPPATAVSLGARGAYAVTKTMLRRQAVKQASNLALKGEMLHATMQAEKVAERLLRPRTDPLVNKLPTLAEDGLKYKGSQWRFPENPKNLLSELPRDAKGRIYPSNNLRIRPEQHPLKPGQTFNSRHHGQHYHLETRRDPHGSWKNNDNIEMLKPPNYEPGSGTGFLPGELFPGIE